MIELWTDGSGTVAGEPGGYAFVLRHRGADGRIFDLLDGGKLEDATSQRAELMAAIAGLRALKRRCAVTVYTDSEYVMKGFTEGRVERWRRNGWMAGRGRNLRVIANRDLWELLAAEVAKHDIAWAHVRGHSGYELNELVDRVAGMLRREAIADQKQNDPPAGKLDGSLTTRKELAA